MARAASKAEPKSAPKRASQVNTYDEELAKFAAEYASMEDGSTGALSFISTKGGRLTFNGGEVPGGRMNVVVLDHIFENHFYADAYDSDNPSSPACFAFGRNVDEMAPHEKASTPQCASCKGCPNNEFGSAERGRGKACKNIRRLALISESDLENIGEAQVAYLKTPVTSVKSWAGYVQELARVLNIPPFAAITEVSIVPDPKSQFKLQFKLVEQLTNKTVVKALMEKRSSIQQELVTPYQTFEVAEEEAPKARTKKPAGKPAGKPTGKPAGKPAGRRF